MREYKNRFESKITKTSGCWFWNATKNLKGYGRFMLNGSLHSAHRVSYDLYVGPIPLDAILMHTCDHPWCVNPEHLIPGTHQENADDKYLRNRQKHPKGENHGRSKISNAQVKEIRNLLANKVMRKDIAKMYGVTPAAISYTVNKRSSA